MLQVKKGLAHHIYVSLVPRMVKKKTFSVLKIKEDTFCCILWVTWYKLKFVHIGSLDDIAAVHLVQTCLCVQVQDHQSTD